MNFDQYTAQFRSLQAGLMQVQLGLVVSAEVFDDFPNKLPSHLSEELRLYAQTAAGVLNAAVADLPKDQQRAMQNMAGGLDKTLPHDVRSSSVPAKSLIKQSERNWNRKLTSPFFMAVVSRSIHDDRFEGGFDFGRAICAQHLFLAFAHADAFGAESMQAILDTCPERLRTNKNLTWQKVQELGSWEAIQGFMKESLCLEFGFRCLADRLVTLRNDFGVNIALDEAELNQLHEAELIRNLFMHAGGIANAEYEKRSKVQAYKNGQAIELSVEDVTKKSA